MQHKQKRISVLTNHVRIHVRQSIETPSSDAWWYREKSIPTVRKTRRPSYLYVNLRSSKVSFDEFSERNIQYRCKIVELHAKKEKLICLGKRKCKCSFV